MLILIFSILVVSLLYYLCHCRYSFGQLVLIKKGFYKGYTGYVSAKNGVFYEIKFKELKDPKYSSLDLTKNIFWWKLKALDVETEKIKEDFWNSVKPKETKKEWQSLTYARYNKITGGFD